MERKTLAACGLIWTVAGIVTVQHDFLWLGLFWLALAVFVALYLTYTEERNS